MTRVRNLVRRVPLFVALVAAGVVAVAVAAVVVFAGGNEKKFHLVDPQPESDLFHVAGSAERYAGAAPMKIKFAAQPFHNSGKVHWFWRFDDGAVSTEQEPSHYFKEPGYYQVLVDGQDEKGNVDRMNVFVGIWPKGLWEKAQAGKPYAQAKEVAKQWERTALRKKLMVERCLKVPVCRKQELAERKAKRDQGRKMRAVCKKYPQCVRDTRKVLREARQKRREARKLGIPNTPLP
jgi:hypothetical protein